MVSIRGEREPSSSPKAQPMPIIEVDDGAVGAEGRRDHAQPAEHAFGAEAFGEPVDMAHAVQQRQDRRRSGRPPWRTRSSRRRGRRPCSSAARGRTAPPDCPATRSAAKAVEIADGAADAQSVLRKLRRAARANEKRHVAARLQQTSAEIAADRACPDNKNSHITQTLSTSRTAAFQARHSRTTAPPRPA